MRPDEYKQAQSRKYQAKLRSQGASESSKEIQEKRKERRLKSRQHKSSDKKYEEIEEVTCEEEYENKTERQNFRRRKVESNSYRYKDLSDTEETTDGIDSGTRNLLQMIDDSETRSFDPSAYFQFKEEKDWDASVETSANESDEIYQNLMNIRFDALKLSLSSASLAERLNLNDDAYIEGQENDGLDITSPIVPRSIIQKSMLRKVKPAETPSSSISNNIIKKSQEKEINLGKKVVSDHVSQVSASKLHVKHGINKNLPLSKPEKPILHSLISNKDDDDDIDDFLKSLDEDDAKQTKQIKSTKSTAKFPLSNNKSGSGSINVNQNKVTVGKNDDDTENWLDDILK